MKKYGIFIAAIVLVVFAAFWVVGERRGGTGGAVACTADAMICPDGTAVGRTGPNCEFAACPAVATASATSTLAIGQSATVNGISLTLQKVLEDSRCPVDVQCIQVGTVRVDVSIDSYNADLTFVLNQPQVVRNMVIMLTSVTPAKHSKVTIQPSDYRFTFTFVPLVATTPGAGLP
jgi:hypothetical protein